MIKEVLTRIFSPWDFLRIAKIASDLLFADDYFQKTAQIQRGMAARLIFDSFCG